MFSFIVELKKNLPEAHWPLISSSLRLQNELWRALQEQEFGKLALLKAGQDLSKWNPAFLALLFINKNSGVQDEKILKRSPASDQFRFAALSLFEQKKNQVKNYSKILSLEESFQLAFAINERFGLKQNPSSLLEDIATIPKKFLPQVLACLMGLSKDLEKLMDQLLGPSANKIYLESYLKAFFSQPLTDAYRLKIFNKIGESRSDPSWISLLKMIDVYSPKLSKQLATAALSRFNQSDSKLSNYQQLERMKLESEALILGGKNQEAMSLLSEAWDSGQRLQAELAAQLASSAENSDDRIVALAALEQAAQLDPGNQIFENKILSGKIKKGIIDHRSLPSKKANQPSPLLSAAKIASKNGQLEEALEMLQSAWKSLKNDQNQLDSKNSQNLFEDLVALALELEMIPMAAKAAKHALLLFPNSATLANSLTLVHIASKEFEAALQSAHLTVALSPDHKAYRTVLAKMLQRSGLFEEALAEWDFVFKNQYVASENDLISFSQCLFESAKFDICEKSLMKLLSEFPESAQGHLLMGNLIAQLNGTGAIRSFEKSIKLDPSQEKTWLALALHKQSEGEIKQAIEILLEAKALFVRSAKLLIQLADLFNLANQSEKAIQTLIEAKSHLDLSNHQKINEALYFQLGTLQIKNGQLDAGIKTFSDAFSLFPGDQGISWAYGKALISKGEANAAIAPLKAAKSESSSNREILLDLCAAQISAKKELAQAENTLAELYLGNPNSQITNILIAECQLAMGNTEDAHRQFSKLVKASEDYSDQFNQLILIGLAKAQMAMKDHNEAITTLESLRKNHPANLDILQNLCLAYSLADKNQEAFQIANHLYLSGERNEALISWFSQQAQKLGFASEASKALEEAIQHNPSTENYRILLAELHWENDQISEAKTIWEKLLNSSIISSDNLLIVSDFLKTHENMRMAARFIRKAIELSQQKDPILFARLSDIYSELNVQDKSLKAINKAIELSPQNPKYLLSKVGLLEEGNQTHAALESLERAITILPKEANLFMRKSQLLNKSGDKLRALSAAETALRLMGQPEDEQIQFAIQLAMDSLNYDRARKIIADINGPTLESICSNILVAFEMGHDIEAAQSIASLGADDFDDAHVQALMGRMEFSKDDLLAANQEYKKALRQIGKLANTDSASRIDRNTLFSTALLGDLLQDWQSCIRIFSKLLKDYPEVAAYQLAFARARINQFEWSQLCEASQIVNNAPAVDQNDGELLSGIIELVQNVAALAPHPELIIELDHLILRARLRLDPANISEKLPDSFPSNEKLAAALESARGKNELANYESDKILSFAKSGRVLIEMAIRNFSAKPNRAFAFAKQAVNRSPKNPAYHAIEAYSAAASENISQAISSIEQALAILPNEARWHAFLGNCLVSSGDSVAALAPLELAVQLESSNPAHLYKLGLLQQESHNHRAAIASFKESIQIDPSQFNSIFQLVNSLLDQGELNLASTAIKNLRKLKGPNSDFLLLRAKLSAAQSQLEKAITFIHDAAELSPERADIYGQWSELMITQGHFESAYSLNSKAAKLAKDAIPWLIKGIHIKALIENNASESSNLGMLFEQYPNKPQIAIALAEAQAQDGNIEAAKATLQKALVNGKSLSIFEQAELHRFFAKTLRNNGQLDQAISELEKSAELANHIVDTHLEMGHVFLARRQRHSALQAFEKASAVDPNSPEPYLQLAQLFKNSKDYVKAEAALRQAVDVAPQVSSIQRKLAAVMTLNLVHQTRSIGVSS